jgi:hypothetical protein
MYALGPLIDHYNNTGVANQPQAVKREAKESFQRLSVFVVHRFNISVGYSKTPRGITCRFSDIDLLAKKYA